MKLLLARHGNTFEKDQTPYIVGRGEDLPLTQAGEDQAARLAKFLQTEMLIPTVIYCGALQRTHRTAEIIGQALALPALTIDPRLTELDYGDWSGLTTDEVRAKFGAAESDAWDRRGIIPAGRNWHPSPDEIAANVQSFATTALNMGGTTLGVTSNGVLRFFAQLVEGLFDDLAAQHHLKVGTGNLCCLEHDGAAWRLVFWNRKP
jgi:probable phosphoglycerate mutase